MLNHRAGSLLSITVLFAILLITSGCAEKKMAGPPAPPPPESILDTDSSFQQSLFKGDQAVLSDQDISRILGTQINLADHHRLAILNLNGANPWSEDIADMEAKNYENLVQALKGSPQLTEIRLLPSLLVPEKRTVPYLREAAARIQADMLFVYVTRIQSFRRDRFLKPDEVRAQRLAESVLLDVRTGIVLQTGRSTENIAMRKTQTDMNFSETIARSEADAEGRAVVSLAKGVVAHLSGGSNGTK
jgi:hypothetical protein